MAHQEFGVEFRVMRDLDWLRRGEDIQDRFELIAR
jgi:hypothetical protein